LDSDEDEAPPVKKTAPVAPTKGAPAAKKDILDSDSDEPAPVKKPVAAAPT